MDQAEAQADPVKDRAGKGNTIEFVQDASVARQDMTGVLYPCITLEHRLDEITDYG